MVRSRACSSASLAAISASVSGRGNDSGIGDGAGVAAGVAAGEGFALVMDGNDAVRRTVLSVLRCANPSACAQAAVDATGIGLTVICLQQD